MIVSGTESGGGVNNTADARTAAIIDVHAKLQLDVWHEGLDIVWPLKLLHSVDIHSAINSRGMPPRVRYDEVEIIGECTEIVQGGTTQKEAAHTKICTETALRMAWTIFLVNERDKQIRVAADNPTPEEINGYI
jgi:hypothetical protein